jgi:hypothetical protein
MTPKEKAQELVDKFYKTMLITMQGASSIQAEQAKRAALLAADEVIFMIDDYSGVITNRYNWQKYWQQVKTEIENL